MRKIKLADHLTDGELIERIEISENKQQFRIWQAVYLIQTKGLLSAHIAEIVRVSSDTVLQWVYLYNNKRKKFVVPPLGCWRAAITV